MGRKYIYAAIAATALAATTFSCSKSSDTAATASNHLYISTGLCYAGDGFTPPTVNNVGVTLSRLNLSTINYEIVKDYGDLADEVTNTFASGIVDGGDGYIYASVENATATGNRRIDKILKAAFGAKTTWVQNSSIFSTTPLKGVARVSDGGILVGGTTTIERFDSTPTQKKATGALSWGQTHAGSCATNNSIITALVALPAFTGTTVGKYIYAHATAGQNDIGIIGMNGSIDGTQCLANAAGASALTNTATAAQGWGATLSATATPTAMVYVATPGGASTGKLLVAYSSSAINTTAANGLSNGLVMYDINETSSLLATITNGQVLYHDHAYFFGVTAMGYDSANKHLYVSSSNSLNVIPVGYNIEKFSIDLTTPGATRVPNADLSSFQSANSFNDCVTGMFVGN